MVVTTRSHRWMGSLPLRQPFVAFDGRANQGLRFFGRVEISSDPQLGQGFILRPGSLSQRKPHSAFGQAIGSP
jgi:hypothetical protein